MRDEDSIRKAFLPGLPFEKICARYETAAGNEFASGKFFSAESSAALAANTFGYFMDRADRLPPLPGTERLGWPALSVTPEECLRFPWAGGHHPYLDVVVRTATCLIGIESKRFEPFRHNHKSEFSEAYWRDVWGTSMRAFEATRDALKHGRLAYEHLDACQLVKHAFGLRTQATKQHPIVQPVLFYLYAEPSSWPDGRQLAQAEIVRHREELFDFGQRVTGDEVAFYSSDYRTLLEVWHQKGGDLATHATAVVNRFAPVRLDE